MANPYYPNLFTPVKVRGLTIKNRVVSSPHSCPFMFIPGVNGAYDYSNDGVTYFANIARGGAGIVNTGHLGVDPRYLIGQNRLYFDFFAPTLRWHQIPMMRRMTDLIHGYGALASFELNHGGHRSTPLEGSRVPGPCDRDLGNGLTAYAMDEEEMDRIAGYFADAAAIGIEGGYDMINVHAGHGWLLGHFFSPLDNKRTDRYGGSVENRARFPRMVLERIRERVGPGVPIEIRFSASELTEGGYGIEEAVETVRYLQDVIDIVQCSVGRLDVPQTECFTFPVQYMDGGVNVYLAEEMRRHVDILVETIGGINDPALAERIVADGSADLVAMARSLIADPNWARKAKHGQAEDIRPCIRCTRCMDSNGRTGVGYCTVNPRRTVYREHPSELPPEKKHIAVVGGGPAGMEAALDLEKKGHSVTLFEKSGRLGGRLAFADHIEFKKDIRRYRDFLIRQIEKAPCVRVQLNTEASPAKLREQGYDAVVLATGAREFIPPIPGIEGKTVHLAADILGRESALGGRVAIIGGGQVGCELAVHLASLGKRVTVVELRDRVMADTILVEETIATKFFLSHEYQKGCKSFVGVPESDRIQVLLNAKCVGMHDTHVTVEQEGARRDIPADDIILSLGFRADDAYLEQFEDVAADVLTIGDARKPGSIQDATVAGYFASLAL